MDRGRLATENARLREVVAREGRMMFLGIVAILLIVGGIGTFVLSRHLAYGDLIAVRQQNEQLQSESQNLKRQLIDLAAELSKTKTDLAGAQSKLKAIMPSENVYNLNPNETRIVADGHLPIGLVGSPANESITLSINGKEHTAMAGQVINVAPDPSTNCQVAVQSFDVFKAVVTAKCTAAKQ